MHCCQPWLSVLVAQHSHWHLVSCLFVWLFVALATLMGVSFFFVYNFLKILHMRYLFLCLYVICIIFFTELYSDLLPILNCVVCFLLSFWVLCIYLCTNSLSDKFYKWFLPVCDLFLYSLNEQEFLILITSTLSISASMNSALCGIYKLITKSGCMNFTPFYLPQV